MSVKEQLLGEVKQWLTTHGSINGTQFSEAGLLERINTILAAEEFCVEDVNNVPVFVMLAKSEMALRHTLCELERFPEAGNYGDAAVVHTTMLEMIKQATTANVLSQNKLSSAVRTLNHLGYSFHGGEHWKPPIRKVA